MTRLGNAKNVVLSRCGLLVNMTNGVEIVVLSREYQNMSNMSFKNIYNELKHYRLNQIITYSSKQI